MEVPPERQAVRLRLPDAGRGAVLEELPAAPGAASEGARVAGQERAHGPRQRGRPRAAHEVEGIRHERPGGEGDVHRPQPAEDVVAVLVIAEAGAAFDPTPPDVVEGVRGIPARATGHRRGTFA